MVICTFTKDEIYPVYYLDPDGGDQKCELTEEEIARHESAMKEFHEVQNLIEDRIKEQNA
jgi:hypothetical protein